MVDVDLKTHFSAKQLEVPSTKWSADESSWSSDKKTMAKDSTTGRIKPKLHKKSKRKLVNSATPSKRNKSNKNSRKQTKRFKSAKRWISYEYQMISNVTWEHADFFRDISNWHDTLKVDDADVQPIDFKFHPASEKIIGNIPVTDAIGNINTGLDQQNKNAIFIEKELHSLERVTMTFGGSVTKDSAEPIYEGFGNNVWQSIYTEKSCGTAAESSTGSMRDHCGGVISEGATKDSTTVTDKNVITFASGAREESLKRIDSEKRITTVCNSNIHMRSHSEENPCKYTESSKMFAEKGKLKKHQHIHPGETPYKCTECQQTFSHKGNLKRHQRNHSGEKPYKCTEFSRMFAQGSTLITHQRTHSGEKPYKCTECPKMFSQRGNLTLHLRIHSGLKPFKCAECPKMFSRKCSLTKHQQTHSGEKPYKCTEWSKIFS